MRIENLYPKPVRSDFATCAQARDDAAATYATKARDLLDRTGGDAIGAISLLMLAADQRKAAEKAAEPTLSEQALAATVREQRDTIDQLKAERDELKTWWKAAADSGARILITDDTAQGVKGVDFLYTDVWVSMGEPKEGSAHRPARALPGQRPAGGGHRQPGREVPPLPAGLP